MTAIPVLLGVKYRFTTSDIVPYLGVGGGFSRIFQKAFYDNSTQNKTRNFSAPTAEVVGGFEFYFAPKAGIRMEVSAFYMKVDQETWSTGGSIADQPNFEFSGNIWSVRYASGLFFMF